MFDVHATRCTDTMKLAAAQALADLVPDPSHDRILPGAFEPGVADAVAKAVARVALQEGCVRTRPSARRS
jgi:malate dehydrogenase (oxaloacetate-decarboxylating)